MDGLKYCIKCKTTKPMSEFGKDKRRSDGLFPYCKRCRLRSPEVYDERQENNAKGLHYCSRCKTWKKPDQFYSNPTRKDGLHHHCKTCSIEQAKAYYHADSERAHRKNKNRYWNNKEVEQAKYREWYAANAERQRQKSRDWHKLNYQRVRHKRLSYMRIWSSTRGKEWRKKYHSTPRGRFILQRNLQLRRIREKAVENTLTETEWFTILELQDYTCPSCGRKFSDNLKPTMDHIIPVSKGQGLTRKNTQALCLSCNAKKHTKIIDYRPPAARLWADSEMAEMGVSVKEETGQPQQLSFDFA